MIVSEEEALERVNSPNNLVHKLFEVRKLHSGRTGPKSIPPMVTALAVSTAAITGNQKESAEAFGMHQTNVSYHKNGSKNEETNSLIKKSVDDVHNKALDGMLSCLEHLQPKIEGVKKATDLANIAGNLAKIVERTTPKDNSNKTNVQVVVYAPRTKGEEEYESIAV